MFFSFQEAFCLSRTVRISPSIFGISSGDLEQEINGMNNIDKLINKIIFFTFLLLWLRFRIRLQTFQEENIFLENKGKDA